MVHRRDAQATVRPEKKVVRIFVWFSSPLDRGGGRGVTEMGKGDWRTGNASLKQEASSFIAWDTGLIYM